jgi:protein tyrosine/serine phosphatase
MLVLLGYAIALVRPSIEGASAMSMSPRSADRNSSQSGPPHRRSSPISGARRPLSPAIVPNFHYVDAHICRGAQPAPAGWNALAKLGIELVVDLRRDGELQEHWIRSEQEAVESAGMRYTNIPMSGWEIPDGTQVSRSIAILESGQRVFVHCRSGQDRTGTVIACYRIAHDHWTRERALSEATSFGMRSYKSDLQRYILSFRP